jgi:hypothetical protein
MKLINSKFPEKLQEELELLEDQGEKSTMLISGHLNSG